MASRIISYSRQFIEEDDIEAVCAVLKSDFLTTGPAVRDFEASLSNYCRADFCVSVTSGTSALMCAYYAIGLEAGDEVIVPAITFAATANAALHFGAKPIFCDIDPETFNIDCSKIEALVTNRTRAIVAVDFGGTPCDYAELRALADQHDLVLIDDAAHSLGATWRGMRIGEVADITTFSFHPVKTITTGEGGAIVTNSKSFADRARLFANHGIVRGVSARNPWEYDDVCLGNNYRLTDIQAALGRSQLKKVGRFVSERNRIATLYDRCFADLETVKTQTIIPGLLSSRHLYPITFDLEALGIGHSEIYERYTSAGIHVGVHYKPVYNLGLYQGIGYHSGICPRAEEYYNGAISLPLFVGLEEEEIEMVVDVTLQLARTNSLL